MHTYLVNVVGQSLTQALPAILYNVRLWGDPFTQPQLSLLPVIIQMLQKYHTGSGPKQAREIHARPPHLDCPSPHIFLPFLHPTEERAHLFMIYPSQCLVSDCIDKHSWLFHRQLVSSNYTVTTSEPWKPLPP